MNRLESFNWGLMKSLFSILLSFLGMSFFASADTQATSVTPLPPRIYTVSPSTVKVDEPTVFTIEGEYLYNFSQPGAVALWFYPHPNPIPLDFESGTILTTQPISLPAAQYKVLVGFPQSNDNITLTVQ